MLALAAVLVSTAAFAIDDVDFESMSAEEYAEWKADYLASEDDTDASLMASGMIRNDYIEAYINDAGHYTMGTTGGNPNSTTDNNKLLLYGHPGSSTTETLIVVDGYEEYFNTSNTTLYVDEAYAVSVDTISGVEVTQIISLIENEYTGKPDVAEIKYILKNTGTTSKQIGARIMLDTMLGSNDGAPFKIPGVGDVTTEKEYHGDDIPEYWQAVDSLTNYSVISTGDFYKNIAERPDKVQFAAWPDIHGSRWDYHVSSSNYVTRDSAVAAYFNPKTVLPGQTRTVVTYYGLSEFEPVYGEVSAILNAPANLYANENGGYENNPFVVTTYIDNASEYDLDNVNVRIELPEELEIEGGDATTKRIYNLYSGSNTSVSWRVRALPMDEETEVTIRVVVSSNELDEDIVVEKVLTLAEIEEEEDRTRTISFDLNGAPGTPPEPQIVPIGGKGVEPQKPTRAGYVFAGWYPNSQCVGFEWFSHRNTGRHNRVDEDITLYAKWRRGGASLSFLYDFLNSGANFNDTYEISNEYFDILTQGLSNGKRQSLLQKSKKGWNGSCYGMGVTEALMMSGLLSPDFYDPDVSTVRELDAPVYDSRVNGMINFYQLSQHLADPNHERTEYDKYREQDAAISDLVEYAQNIEGVEDYICMIAEIKLPHNKGSHALMVYGIEEEDNGDYRIKLFESNENESLEASYMIVPEDLSDATFYCDWSDDWNGISVSERTLSIRGLIEQDVYNTVSLQEELIDRGYEIAPASLFADSEYDVITTSFNNPIVEDEDGYFAEFDGTDVSGDLEPEYVSYLGIDGGLEMAFENREFYTIYCGDDNTEEKYEVTLLLAGSEYISVESDVMFTVSVSTYEGIVVSPDEEANVKISVTRDEVPVGSFYVQSLTEELYLEYYDGEYGISSYGGFVDGVVGITNDNSYNEIELDSSSDYYSANYEDIDNGISILNVDGETVEELEMVYNVSFYTYGGTFVEDAVNVRSGECVDEPDEPEFEGFVFGGWYKTADCVDGEEWDFEEDEITEDTIIHAKWLADEDFMHSVIFRAEGFDDIIVLVRDGRDLEDVPEVPYKEGYEGQWDIDEFTNITSSMIVNALYYAAVEAPVADPEGGVYEEEIYVSLYTYTDGADIYYTLDGSDPREEGVLYTEEILISKSTVLKAYAALDGEPDSAVMVEEYIIDNTDSITLEVDYVESARVGTEVVVNLNVTENPGFGGMAYDVVYDNSVLELVSYEKEIASEISVDSGDIYDDKMNFQYAGTSNVEEEGVLVSFTFRIKEDAPEGFTEIYVVPDEAAFFGYDGYEEIDLVPECIGGGINVIFYTPGDSNGDGVVNNRDAARILQYLAGWDVECVEAALDVNGDGIVNNRDAARILQYLAGWDVELH